MAGLHATLTAAGQSRPPVIPADMSLLWDEYQYFSTSAWMKSRPTTDNDPSTRAPSRSPSRACLWEEEKPLPDQYDEDPATNAAAQAAFITSLAGAQPSEVNPLTDRAERVLATG